jgi:hypothetical protein
MTPLCGKFRREEIKKVGKQLQLIIARHAPLSRCSTDTTQHLRVTELFYYT